MLRTTIRGSTLLIRDRLPGLYSFAKSERLPLREAASQLLKLAHFHRAAELFLSRSIPSTSIISEVLRRAKIDEEACFLLAKDGPRSGSAWASLAYSRLFTASERRMRGQFFTPDHIASFMTSWAIRSPTDSVLDPGTGPGIFLRAAYKRLQRLGSKDPGRKLTGVEVSPAAATFAQLALAPLLSKPAKIISGDFLTHKFGSRVYDAIVGNPPYSRHHALSSEYKHRIGTDADAMLSEHLSLRAGLYVHFLIRSLALLREGGRLAFLTPLEFFNAQYGAPLRRHLLKTTRLRTLIVFDPSNGSAFADANTTSAIILAEGGNPDGRPVRIVHIKGDIGNRELIHTVRNGTAKGLSSWGTSTDIPLHQLVRMRRWSDALLPTQSRGRKNEITLRAIAEVKRGIATGANSFFVLSDKAARAAGLTRKYLRPVISRARFARNLRITQRDFDRWKRAGERVWLLDIRKEPTRSVRRYLESGKKAGFHQRYLCRTRKVWFRMEERPIPEVIVTYMSKSRPRFILNEAGVVPLNVFHAIYPRNLTQRELKQLVDYLNGEACRKQLTRIARLYGSGLLKIEPRELLSLRIPDVRGHR